MPPEWGIPVSLKKCVLGQFMVFSNPLPPVASGKIIVKELYLYLVTYTQGRLYSFPTNNK